MKLTTLQPGYNHTDYLLNSFFDTPISYGLDASNYTCVPALPALNVQENNTAYEIKIAAPGQSKENFSIIEEDGLLNISCTQTTPADKEDNANKSLHTEFNHMNFTRKLQLPKERIDLTNITASYREGILHVHIPKHKKAIPNRHTISIE